jgi:uncharacterized RDD family membrane protein YckC
MAVVLRATRGISEYAMKPASLWIRALAAVIDVVLVCCVFFLIVHHWGAPNDEGGWTVTGVPALLLILGMAAYWIVPEWLAGTTFGKWACGLCVVKTSGNPITLAQAIERNVARIVDAFGFYLVAFIAARNNPNRRRLGDLWARTMVVRCSELKRQTTTLSSETGSSSTAP